MKLVIKKIVISFFTFLLFITSSLPSFALAIAQPIEPVQIFPQTQILGQNQYYTVHLRGNGEAVVYLKTIFTNTDSISISHIQFKAPRISMNDLVVFQVLKDRQCIQYKAIPVQPTPSPDQKAIPQKLIPPTPLLPGTQECEQYQEPDYYSYWSGTNRYQKAEVTKQGDTILIYLPASVQPNSSGSILLTYRTSDYITKNPFGAFEYSFETLRTQDNIYALQVGITTDPDLKLKGVTANTNYVNMNENAKTLLAPSVRDGIQDTRFDSFYSQIGYGTIVKSSSNLQPGESYTVKGAYADATLKLYGQEFARGLGIFLLIMAVILFLANIIHRKIQKMKHSHKDAQIKNAHTMSFVHIPLLWSIALSFAASFFILLYTIFLFLLSSYSNSVIQYYYQFNIVLIILLATISCGVYAFFLFIPSLFIGYKKGVLYGVTTFVCTILWLILYVGIIFIGMLLFYPRPDYPIPMIEQSAPAQTK